MKTYLEPTKVELLEHAATNLRDRLLIRLFWHLGCWISEALAVTVQDIDFQQGTVTIQHLKTRLKLACPHCNAGLGRSHAFCPGCGAKVEEAVAQSREHRRVRTLPLDDDTLEMLREYIDRGGSVFRNEKQVIFGINRHQTWRVVQDCARRADLGDLVNPETGRVRGVSPQQAQGRLRSPRHEAGRFGRRAQAPSGASGPYQF